MISFSAHGNFFALYWKELSAGIQEFYVETTTSDIDTWLEIAKYIIFSVREMIL